ncbi:hypothetical protein D3C73_1103250 [compost metagenome]
MRCLTLQGVGQLATVNADKKIVRTDAEAPAQAAQVHHPRRVEQPGGLFHHVAHLFAHLQRLGCRHQATTGAHQNRIADRLANARQRATHGRRAEVHPPRRAHHATFVEQGVEGDQKVDVRELHAEHSLAAKIDSSAMLANIFG